MNSDEKYMYIDKDTNTEELYDFITNELSFNKVVELYKLLHHKMIFLNELENNILEGTSDIEPKGLISAFEEGGKDE